LFCVGSAALLLLPLPLLLLLPLPLLLLKEPVPSHHNTSRAAVMTVPCYSY
jgi:hypothetical protein